ncbi:outer membrane protein [Escherichia coli]|uniref:Outer membrane protein n=1 Tax=Escherichia coli TaxID=562 RepID=A0A376W964_ECOLX|nr:outer membrane protein [Escherichia coli]
MWGHMPDTLKARDYTFSRPKLAAEVDNEDGTVNDHNETWSTFTWSGADNHCDILPGMRQFGALATVVPTSVQDVAGWPMQGNFYWSSLAGMSRPAPCGGCFEPQRSAKTGRYDVYCELCR